jgi:hypothetical protein
VPVVLFSILTPLLRRLLRRKGPSNKPTIEQELLSYSYD